MEIVRRLREAGSSITGAIREALSQRGLSVSEFADKYDRNRSNMNQVICGTRAPADKDVNALIDELGGTADEWRELLHDAGRPTAKVGG